MSAVPVASSQEHTVVHAVQLTLKYIFGLVPMVAGADKFANFLAHWENYLNPHIPALTGLSPTVFMHIVGVIEIIAGILVFAMTRLGAIVVTAWLLAIALQLVAQGAYLDIAVRDIVIALAGSLTLARLTPLVSAAALDAR